jgi:hypothetical protein
MAFKKPKGGELTDEQKNHNKAHNENRAVSERGNSLLNTTFKALRNISRCRYLVSASRPNAPNVQSPCGHIMTSTPS